VLYEMVAGRPPFAGEYPQAVMYGILNEAPEPLTGLRTGVPIQLDGVIAKALAKDPADRYQTLADLAVDLRGVARVVAGGPATPSPVTGPTPVAQATAVPMKRPLWKRWPAGVAAVLLLAAIGAGIYLWAPWRVTEKPWRPVRLKLAVLPFENLGGPDKEYVADGVTEEITGRLAEVYGLSIVARTSVLKYKRSAATVPQIAAELGVDYLLEGSVRWQGGAAGAEVIRVTAQLIRAADGTHLWNEQYDEAAADILGKQSLIAEKVAAAMVVKLVDGEWQGYRDKIGQPLYTRNAAAYDSYIKAGEQAGAGKLDEALKLYKQATQLDPGFTDAYFAQYDIHFYQYITGSDRSERRVALAWQALEKARGLEPESPWYHLFLSKWYCEFKGDYQLAEEEALLTERGAPGSLYIPGYLRVYAERQGKWGQSLRYAERVAALNPKSVDDQLRLGVKYLQLQRYADAERALRRTMALDPEGKNLWPHVQWARMIIRRDGDAAKAARYLDNLPPGLRQASLKDRSCRNIRAWAAGRSEPERTLEEIEKLPDIVGEGPAYLTLKAFLKGRWLRERGRAEEARPAFDEALRQLDRLAEERKGKGQEAKLLAHRRDILASMGRKEEAIRLSRQVIEMTPREKESENHFNNVYVLAAVATLFGEDDLALDQLEYYFSQPLPDRNINEIKVDQDFRPLLSLPRFKALEKKYPPDKPYTGP